MFATRKTPPFSQIFCRGSVVLNGLSKEVKPRLAKRPLVFNDRLANRGLTSLVNEASVIDQRQLAPHWAPNNGDSTTHFKRNRLWLVISGTWCRHQMETFSALLALCAGNSPVKGQWRGALMFFFIYAWTNGWINNRDAGDLRRHCAHHDDTVMIINGRDILMQFSKFFSIVRKHALAFHSIH